MLFQPFSHLRPRPLLFLLFALFWQSASAQTEAPSADGTEDDFQQQLIDFLPQWLECPTKSIPADKTSSKPL